MGEAGRPRKLDDEETQRRFLEMIEKGVPIVHAAHANRFSESTVARRRKDDGDFDEAIKRAEALAVETALDLITKAAKENWQAAAWFLERRYPQMFGRRAVITGDTEGLPVKFRLDLGDGMSAESDDGDEDRD